MKIFTIGYGGRAKNEFLELLQNNSIASIVDVRLRPDRASMGIYSKAKSPEKGIEALLNSIGIRYYSFVELGNLFLDFPDDWIERYTKLLEKGGALLTKRLFNVPQPFCLMCAEKKVEECHRGLITKYLNSQQPEIQVLHL
jgi:uncharacterized protein (DUF488 family)